jgi:dCTP deaminase
MNPGLLPRASVAALIARGAIAAERVIEPSQIQPASLDLRLAKEAYRLRASFLPGRTSSVRDRLASLSAERMSLEGEGAVLEKGIVYLAPLCERLALPETLTGAANPKSSTGRLDIFVRLIVDGGAAFDEAPAGYHGPLWVEMSPRSFSVRVREGTRLNQLRLRDGAGARGALSDETLKARHAAAALVDGPLDVRDGLVVHVGLAHPGGGLVGFRAIKSGSVIDVDRPGAYAAEDFWEPIRARAGRLILDPDEFYILASRERMQVPSDLAAEMAAIDPALGEFRVHYAGFFDPGFGWTPSGAPGAKAVLEVRGRDVPFLLEDGQPIGRLVFEPLAAPADALYGAIGGSNYQGQGLKLSKHFRAWEEG